MSTDATFGGSAASPRPQPTAHSRSLFAATVAQTQWCKTGVNVATAVLLLLLLVLVLVVLLMIAVVS